MAGKKRLRSSKTGASADAAAATADSKPKKSSSTAATGSKQRSSNATKNVAASKSTSSTATVWKIVHRLTEIAASRSDRSLALLQACAESKITVESLKTTAASSSSAAATLLAGAYDAQWLIVATQLLNRLLMLHKNIQDDDDDDDEHRLLVVAALCDAISRILVSESSTSTGNTKWLDSAMHSPTSRSPVARALLSATVGAMWGGVLSATTTTKPTLNRGRTLVLLTTTTAALDRLVHLQETEVWMNVDWLSSSSSSASSSSLPQELEEACVSLAATQEEEDCVSCLEQAQGSVPISLTATTTSGSNTTASGTTDAIPLPPATRGTRNTRRKTSTAAITTTATSVATSPPSKGKKKKASAQELANLSRAMETLLGDQNHRVDARMPVKRLVSTAIVWYQRGSRHLLECVHLLATKNELLSPQELSQILRRLLAVVAEAGINSGIRSPTGATDAYLNSLLWVEGNRTEIVGRADIRDWAVVAMYDILKIHRQCLEQSESKIVNDCDENGNGNSTTAVATCSLVAPKLGNILYSLCRAAAMSVSQSGYLEHIESIRALTGIATAFLFQLLNIPGLPLDCRLFQLAVYNLVETLHLLDHQSTHSSPTLLEQDFRLSTTMPLPLPCIPNSADDDKNWQGTASAVWRQVEDADPATLEARLKSTFAGMWTPRLGEFTTEDALSFILQSLSIANDGQVETAASKLVTVLTELIRRAYDTRVQPKSDASSPDDHDHKGEEEGEEDQDDLDAKSKAKGGRKRAANLSGGRKSKKSKNTAKKDSVALTSSIITHESGEEYQRITPQRAMLAKDALTALSYGLTIKKIPSQMLTMEHVQELIRLGDLFDKVLVKTRLGISRYLNTAVPVARLPETTTSDPLSHEGLHTNEFTVYEKTLWAAHMNMCHVLGRGQPNFDGAKINILFTEPDRKSIVKSLPEAESSGKTEWPLSLPAAHHAFLVANFTSHAMGPEHCSAEQHLVKQYIKSIGKELQNLEDMRRLPKETNCLYLDDGILLSYKDARTLLLAFSRLPQEQQRKNLEALIFKVLMPSLKAIQGNSAKEELLAGNEEASSFVARVLVVFSAMLSLVAYGRPLRQALIAHAGPTIIQAPGFHNTNEWSYREYSYMGLFGEWQCPTVPDALNDVVPSLVLMKSKTTDQIKSLLEIAFALGFETARIDQCYLLFAAWNGLGKLYFEGGAERLKPSDSTSLQIIADNYPKRILQIRNDICLIYNSGHCSSADGLRSVPATRLRSNLKSTLYRANILMGRLLETAATDTTPSMSLFSLLATLPTYISSSIAAHTKPGNDHFTITLKGCRRRSKRHPGNSSDMEVVNSDLESEDTDGGDFDSDIQADAMSRLRECCDAFGAAPIHPDWLDASCSFQEGIRCSDAIENAETALRILNKLINVAFDQYQKNFLEALKAFKPGSNEVDNEIELALDLLPWNTHEPTSPSPHGLGTYSNYRDWKEDISLLCNLPEGLLELVTDDSFVQNTEAAKESWCPNVALSVSGKLRDRKRPPNGGETSVPELRAGGEWELLLADALTLASLDVKRYPDEYLHGISLESDEDSAARLVVASRELNLDEEAIQNGHIALKRAQMWHSIMTSATSHLLPAAALLRMGINKVGRKPHPFSLHENAQDPFDVAPLTFLEPLGNVGSTSQLGKITAQATMSTLSRICASSGDDTFSVTCHAVAAHLFIDTDSFVNMVGLESIRLALNGLKATLGMSDTIVKKATSFEVFPYVVERLTLILEDFGYTLIEKDFKDREQDFGRLASYFGASSPFTVDTIVGNFLNVFDILNVNNEQGTRRDQPYEWSNREIHLNAVQDLVSILCGIPFKANDRSRSCAAVLLARLTASEQRRNDDALPSLVLSAILEAFDKVNPEHIKSLILEDLCCMGGRYLSLHSSYRVELSHLLIYMMSKNFKHAKFIHNVLLESFPRWPRSRQYHNLQPAFDALLLFGCRFNSLKEIGCMILNSGNPAGSFSDKLVDLELVSDFFAFVKHLKDAISKNDNPEVENSDGHHNHDDGDKQSKQPKPIASLGRQCSFVEKTGYHGQHWYNCYTCGLVWEKGCCTMCALVCHKGHDVAYSRYSSFFCDCAAEDGTASSQNRVSCACLIQLPSEDMKNLSEAEASDINLAQQIEEDNFTSVEAKKPPSHSLSIEIAYRSFGDEARRAVTDFTRALSREDTWFLSLFYSMRQQFTHWNQSKLSSSDILPITDGVQQENTRPTQRVSPLVLQRELRDRHAKPLDLKNLPAKTILPVRSVKGFQTKMSSDSSSNVHLLAELSKHDISRQNVVSDSRGRLVVAEPCSLLFCSAVPAAVVRYTSRAHESPLTRQQMCILGTATVAFNIVGMRLCSENELHLIVWGLSDACVVVLKPCWSGVETKIDLVLDLDQNDGDSDHLVKCEFVPGSQTNLVVGCGRYVRVFDISRTKEQRASAVVAYNLGFEASLRDIALVPINISNDGEVDPTFLPKTDHATISRMFMLLENGRLHSTDLKADAEGRMESPSDQPCELSGSVSLPTSGVRPRTGSVAGIVGSVAKSLGEASRIVYLKQSRILLYKCVSSCVLALILDSNGHVEGSFELIPHVISSDILGNGIDGHSVAGPFNHWTELGVVYNDNGMFFRVACIGRSSRTNQPKMICIEFNSSDVFVKEIMWSSTSSVGVSLSLPFEGLATFSLPFIGDARRECRSFGERMFLCTSTSAGSLLFFGEEVVDTVGSPDENGPATISLVSLSGITPLQVEKPMFPLTIFEKLKNASDCEELVFSGEGTGCTPTELKSRLLRDHSSSFTCLRREGCTLSITLRERLNEKGGASPGDCADKISDRTHAIAALRVLVGSTITQIPSKLSVQGRSVDLTPRVKKWYSLPLTNEEMVIGVRNGMVSLGIGSPFDSSSSSSVDAIEVYVVDRKLLTPWLQRSYIKKNGKTQDESNSNASRLISTPNENDDETTKGLLLSARALSFLCELCPESAHNILNNERTFVRALVEGTAFTRNKVVSETLRGLVAKLEPNDRLRSSLYDESILRGWMNTLGNAKSLLDESTTSDADVKARWDATRSILQDCLNAVSKISRERPMNYLQCMGNVSETDNSSGSIALDASILILEGARRSLPCSSLIDGPEGIIELCLTEIAIGNSTEFGEHLATFEIVKKFLESSNRSVAEIACRAVSDFCERQGLANQDEDGLFGILERSRLIAYRCDSCGLCPLKDIKYTYLEEDIDLCKECFSRAEAFAVQNDYGANVEVTIDGRTVGAETKLTCAQLPQMQAVPLAKMDIIAARQSFELSDEAMDEDEDLQKALRLSLGENASEYGQETYENFVSHLFASTLEVLSAMLKNGSLNSKLAPILRLLLDLIWNSSSISSQNEWARQFAREVSHGISFLLNFKGPDGVITRGPIWSIIACLRSMQLLIFPDVQDSSFSFEQLLSEEDTRSRTHPDVVCDVHGILAVRRRSAKGKHKDRRFYVCGKERGQRCNFFKWADDVELKSRSKSRISSRLKEIVRSYLWIRLTSEKFPLNAVLCEFLEKEMFSDDDEMGIVPSCNAHSHEMRTSQNHISSRYGKIEMERDVEDGVFCSREKLQDAHPNFQNTCAANEKQDIIIDLQGNGEIKSCLLEACLGLLALVADYKTVGITRWFSLLCKIDISTARSFEVRSLARTVLKSLCGKKRAMYHSIRDHFSFGFQLQALYKNASPMLEAALLVSERSRVCSPLWATNSKVDWTNLPIGGLIGTEDLITGSDCSQGRLRKVGEVLNDLWCVIKNGGESWRRFCGQASLPISHRGDMKVNSGMASVEQKMLESPPIVALFWMACALPAVYQVKALRLIDAALTDPEENFASENVTEHGASVSGVLIDDDILFTISGARPITPETLLLTGDNSFSVDDFAAFAFNVLSGGKGSDVRRIGYLLLTKIVPHIPSHERSRLFQQLFSSKFLLCSTTGKGCIEYLNLLQFLAQNLGSDTSLRKYGDLVLDTFMHQVDSVKYDRSNGEWVVVETGLGTSIKRKFDLSECLYCLQTKAVSSGKDVQKEPERRDTLSTIGSPGGSHKSSIGSKRASISRSQKKWHPEQVSPFSRYRIDALKLASSSNEFSSFIALRHRVVLSDVALTVNDPRGRFVKNISVYYSSRPADNATELKAAEYALHWHKCASLSLPRGATRANANIPHPVVAANLKIEYTDFYERPGGSKASDGSLLVHCPRCTRVVTNAHGVCGNCGEVAFQCRKCRHINYDRLDAFLCVECGYCASGTFSMEVTAAVASNAIAIVSDKDCDRVTRILGAVNTVYEEINTALSAIFRQIEERKQVTKTIVEKSLGDDINRALMGLPPILEDGRTKHESYIERLDKQGSIVKVAARPESYEASIRSTASLDRTRSYLRLARQIRSESSGSAWDRRRSGDMIIRHLGRGIAVENIEEESDLIGLLEGGNGIESSESLSRTIANARSGQGDSLGALIPPSGSIRTNPLGEMKRLTAKEMLEECQRLHMLMREAQRERYELKRSIGAWQRLNRGSLVDVGVPIQDDDTIETCHCSVCGPVVAFHLLRLWSRLFTERPSEVNIDGDFLRLLLYESTALPKTLLDCMREVVKDIATKSERGAKLVLEEIRKRLLSTNDPVSAEILGKIMGADGQFMAQEYSDLAMELLAKNAA